MTVVDVTKDMQALTLTVTCEFDASPDDVWKLWENPRLLEKWWGPPGYPATFEEHALEPGAMVGYYMTTPTGEKPRGWWRILTVDAPKFLEFNDGFADEDGNINQDISPGTMRIDISPHGERTRMVVTSLHPDLATMQQVLEMGMEEGFKQALDQIDALLV